MGEPQRLLIMVDYFADRVWLRTADGRGSVSLPRYRIGSPKHFAEESFEQ
jgi:hypothetical protein